MSELRKLARLSSDGDGRDVHGNVLQIVFVQRRQRVSINFNSDDGTGFSPRDAVTQTIMYRIICAHMHFRFMSQMDEERKRWWGRKGGVWGVWGAVR